MPAAPPPVAFASSIAKTVVLTGKSPIMKISKLHKRLQTMARSDTLAFTVISDENGQAHVDFSGPQVLVNGRPVQDVKVVRSYARSGKKDKIISSINYGSNAPKTTGYMSQWSPANVVVDRFDSLIAVDTNTKFINGVWTSVTAAWVIEPEWKKSIQQGRLNMSLLSCFMELHAEPPVDTEGRGWYTTLHFGLDQQHATITPQSIGLIVDSKLGDHDRINARTLGYFSNHMLPPSFNLVYASDAAADSFLNKMIRQCDKTASDILLSVENGETDVSGLTPTPRVLVKVELKKP